MKKFLETAKVVLICLVVFLLAGLYAYACEVQPMQECEDRGHSFTYCWKLLHRE